MQASVEKDAAKPRAKVISLFGSRNVASLFRRAIALDGEPETEVLAIALYREVVRIDPTHAATWNNLGVIYFRRRQFCDALEAWGRALRAEPFRAESLSNLGALWEFEGKYSLAISMYVRALDADGDLEDARANLAGLLDEMGQRGRALRHWERYLERHPEGVHAGRAWARVGKR